MKREIVAIHQAFMFPDNQSHIFDKSIFLNFDELLTSGTGIQIIHLHTADCFNGNCELEFEEDLHEEFE
jgi:hypothetical protein